MPDPKDLISINLKEYKPENIDYNQNAGFDKFGNLVDYGSSQYDKNATIEDLQRGDLNEIRAQKQSGWDKATNGVLKAVGKLVPRVIEGYVNPIYGPIKAQITNDFSNIWDNEITNASNQAQQWLDEKLPLYNSKDFSNAHGFQKLAYTNTLWGDILDGVSYSGAALLSGSLYTKSLALIGKAASLGKLSEYLGNLEKIKDSSDAIKTIDNASKQYKLINGIKQGTYAAVGAGVEASQQALSDSNEWAQNMEYVLTHDKEGHATRQLTDNEKQWIETNKKSLGNTSFALNLPIIMADNWIVFGKTMLAKKSLEKEGLKEVADRIGFNAAEDSYYTLKKDGIQKLIDKTYGIKSFGESMLAEGGQETEQQGVTRGTQDYYTKKYYNPDAASFMDSFAKGISTAFSEEGSDSFLIGALSAGLFGNATKLIKEGASGYKNPIDKQIQESIDLLNKSKSKDIIKNAVETFNRHSNLSNEYDEAVKNNDSFIAMNKMDDMMNNLVTSRIKTGKIEDLKNTLNDMKSMSQNEFEDTYGIKLSTDEFTGIKQSVADFIQTKLNSVNKIESLNNSINTLFPEVSTNIKDRVLYAAFSLENSQKRANDLNNKTTKILQDQFFKNGTNLLIGDNSFHTDNYLHLDNKQKEEFKKAINSSNISPISKEQINNNLFDIDKLLKRKELFIKEYEKLLKPNIQEEINNQDGEIEKELNSSNNKTDEELENSKKETLDKIFNSEDHEEIQELAKQLASNKTVTEEDVNKINEHYENIKHTSVRRKQVSEKLKAAKEVRDTLKNKLESTQQAVQDKLDRLTDIHKTYNDSPSEKRQEVPVALSHLITGLSKDIKQLENTVETLEKQLKDVENKISKLESKLEQSYADLANELNHKKLDRGVIEGKISFIKSKIKALKKLLKDLIKIFNNLYPHAKQQFDGFTTIDEKTGKLVYEDSQSVEGLDDASMDLSNKQADLRELNSTLKEFKTELKDINAEIKDLEDEISEYLSHLNKIKPLDFTLEHEEPVVNPEFTEYPEQKANETNDFMPPKKDVSYVFFSTAGNNVKYINGEPSNEITDDEDQKRWFAFTDKLRLSKLSGYVLRTFHADTQDELTKSLGFDKNKYPNKIVVVLYRQGENNKLEPVKVDGKYLFTTLRDSMTLDELKEGIATNKFTNKKKLDDKGLQAIITHYNAIRESILKSKTPTLLKINGKTRGVAVETNVTDVNGKRIFRFPLLNRILKKDNAEELSKLKMTVATSELTQFNGDNIDTYPGEILIEYNSQIVKGRVAKLKEINGAVSKVLSLLKQGMSEAEEEGGVNTKTFIALNKLINYGNISRTKINTEEDTYDPYRIFITKKGLLCYTPKGSDKFKYVSLKNLNDDEVTEFLGEKYFRVSKDLLAENAKNKDGKGEIPGWSGFVDPITGKKWATYREFLFSTEGRANDQVPVGINLEDINQQQFKSVGLHYENNSYKPTTPKKKTTNTEKASNVEMSDTFTQRNTGGLQAENTGKHNPKYKLKENKNEAQKAFEKGIPFNSEEEFTATEDSGLTAEDLGIDFNNPKDVFNQETKTNKIKPENKQPKQEEEITPDINNSSKISDIDSIKEVDKLSSSNNNLHWDDFSTEPQNKLYNNEKPASKEQLDKEWEWLKSVLPSITYERVRGLIDRQAVGRFMSYGKILISDLAAAGVTFHEAWHFVSTSILTQGELNLLYNEWKETNKNKLLKTYKGEYKKTSDFNDKEIEEAMAEQFRSYMLGEDMDFGKKQTSIFQKIINFIKQLFGIINNSDIKTVFDNIKNGVYKSSKPNLFYNKNFNCLPGKSVEFTDMIVKSTNVLFFNKMFNAGTTISDLSKHDFVNIYNDILSTFKGRWNALSDEQKKLLANDYLYIFQNWNHIVGHHITFLKSLGIDLKIKKVKSEDKVNVKPASISEEDFENDELENQGKDQSVYVESVRYSTIDGMPPVIKLLVASLPEMTMEYNKEGSPIFKSVFNKLGLVKNADFQKTAGYLQDKLVGVQDFDDMVVKLTNLSLERPEISQLLKYLKTSIANTTPETLSVDEVSLQEKFFQQFAKTKPVFLTTLIDYDGNVYHVDSNDYQLGKKIKSNWDNNTKDDYYSGKGIWKKDEKGKITLLKERLKNYITNNPLNVFSNNIKFLNLLGVKFSTDTFTKEEQEVIKNATNKIYKYILDNPDVNDIFNSNIVNTEINNLVNIESNYTKDQIELQHINAENKTIYGITLNNYLSLITNDITNGNTPDHLLEKNNPYVKNSYWLQKIREGKKIEIAINEGYKINEQGEEGEVISAASPSNLYLSHINSILNGVFPFLQNADRKLSYAVKTDITFGNDDFNHILQGYMYDELIRIAELHKKNGIGTNIENYNKDGEKFTIFFDFPFEEEFRTEAYKLKNNKQINEFLIKHNDEINKVFDQYFKNKTEELLKELKKYHLILDDVNNKFTISGIDKTKVNELLGTSKENYTKSDLELVASYIYKNQFIAYVEQSKIFTGDLALFKDPFKRFSMISGTKKISDTRSALDNWLNKNFIRKDKKQADGTYNVLLSHDVLGNVDTDYIEILKTFGLSDSDIAKYMKYEETDGQGWITLDEHREFLMRNGDLPTGYQKAWEKAQRGEELSKDELMFFMPIKPQAYTPKVGTGMYDATGIKCSFCPLIPSMIKNTIGLKDMLKYMTDNKIGIHVVGSVEKFGATLIDGKIPEFYDENGKFNTKNKNIQTFPYKYLGIQLDIAPVEKDKVTFGTQFRKLIMTNLFAFGKSKKIRVLRNSKLEPVDTQELFDRYENAVSKLTEIKRNQLKKELSLEHDGINWKIKNFDKLKDFIINAALDRNSADNVIESIKLALNSDNKAIDATSMKNKIENLLSSIINNDVISQKMFGDMKVMGTSAGWETKPRVVNGEHKGVKKWLPSNETLKFYTDENEGVSKMEIYLPDIYRSKFGDENGFTIGNDLSKVDKRLLEVIGFRIPTQGFNSMESIIIKGFLPKEAGNLVVVPSELVVKAGIDFDVDKMNILYPSVFKVGNKLFYLSKDNIPEIYKEIQNKVKTSFTIESKNEITQKELEYSKLSPDEFIKKFFDDNEEGLLKNEVLETSKEILSSPEVAKELLKPNGTETLKTIVNHIREITQSGRGKKPSSSKVVDLMHNIKVAIALWSGKDGVGATALHNTTHVIAQKAGLYINSDTSIGLKHNEVEDKPGLISLSGEYTYDGKHKITDLINEFLSAYVDVAKDDIVFDLNAGMQTVNIWMYLLRAGCSPNEIAYFMRQPIIRNYVIAQQINESIPNKLADKELSKNKLIKKVIENFHEEFKVNPVKVEKLKISDNLFDEKILEHNIKKPLGDKDDRKENPQFLRDQLHYLQEFIKYQDDAKKLSDLINASKFDTIGVDKNRGANRQRIKNLNKIINDGFFGNLDNYLNDSVIKEFYKTATEAADYYNDLFITDGAKARRVLSQIDEIFDKREINSTTKAELMDIAENEFISYLLQNIPFDKIALGQEIERLTTGVNSIAKQFKRVVEKYMNDEKAKNNSDHFINNPFIKELQWILNNKNKDKDFLKLFSRKYNTYQANQLREGFLKLFEISPKLAEDIMKLGIIQSGLNNSPISFMSIIPAEKYFELANRIITKYKNSNDFDYNKFISLFHNNNRKNSKLVPVITSRMKFKGWSVKISNDYTKLTMDLDKVSPNFANALYVRNLVKNPEFEKKNEQQVAELKAQGKEKFIEMIYKQTEVPGVYVRTQPRGDGMWYHDYYQNEEFIEKPFSDEALNNFNTEEDNQTPNTNYNSNDVVAVNFGNEKSNNQETTEQIYSKLGNKTVSGNVQVVDKPYLHSNEQRQGKAVVAYKIGTGVKGELEKVKTFENPFHVRTDKSTKENVIDFIDFVLNSNEPQAQWIREQLKSGKYKGKPIYYGNTKANKSNEPSHATALDYLINKYDWNQEKGNEQSKANLSNFQGYKGGFENTGKGTPQGDGKDKAMREVADGFIGEIDEYSFENRLPSSTRTSAIEIGSKNGNKSNASVDIDDKGKREITSGNQENPKIVMLARNGKFKGTELNSSTKSTIKYVFSRGAEFVVGDMPNVDSQFIDYLQEIGAKFTIYHTGNESRIKVKESNKQSNNPIINFFETKFNLPVEYDNTLKPNESGYVENGKVFLNPNIKTENLNEVLVEEFTHLITTKLEKENPTQFEALFQDLLNTPEYKDIREKAIAKINSLYPELLKGEQDKLYSKWKEIGLATFLSLSPLQTKDNIQKFNTKVEQIVDNSETKLSNVEEGEYNKWYNSLPKRLQYTEDYDLKGLFKDIKNNPQQYKEFINGLNEYNKIGNDNGFHGVDKFKKPNHFTFSDESIYSNSKQQGGKWIEKNGKWEFHASDFNLLQHSPKELEQYFKENEPDSKLVLPDSLNLFHKEGKIDYSKTQLPEKIYQSYKHELLGQATALATKEKVSSGLRAIADKLLNWIKNTLSKLRFKKVSDIKTFKDLKNVFEDNNVRINLGNEQVTKEQQVEEYKGFWTRDEVAKQTDKVFLFGDNTNDRVNTKYVPSSTQAVIRGLPNAIGIDTKKDRGTNEGTLIKVENNSLKNGDVVYSKKGEKTQQFIFRGLREEGKLGARSPRLEDTDGEIVIPGENVELYKKANSSYFTDADFAQFKKQVDEAIQKAKDSGKTIVIPADGIGTGKAMLKEKAPKLFEYLQQELNKLKSDNTEEQQDKTIKIENFNDKNGGDTSITNDKNSVELSKESVLNDIINGLTILNEDKTLSIKEKNSKIKALRELKNIVENKKSLTEKDLGEIRRKFCNIL